MKAVMKAISNCWIATDGSHAGPAGEQEQSVFLRWELNFLSRKFCEKVFYCFDRQHGRLVTWKPFHLITNKSNGPCQRTLGVFVSLYMKYLPDFKDLTSVFFSSQKKEAVNNVVVKMRKL